jgi:hypothetical protein
MCIVCNVSYFLSKMKRVKGKKGIQSIPTIPISEIYSANQYLREKSYLREKKGVGI